MDQEELNLSLHPKVVEAIDDNNLTPLQGLILHYCTDPETDYNSASVAGICQNMLQKGSKRSVRRFRQEFVDLIDSILLNREMEIQANDFTTEEMEADGLTITVEEDDKGGNGEDKDGITDDGEFWDVTEELDCVKACSKAPEKAFVYVSAVARKKMNLFMKWAKHQEWLAYLSGKWVSDNEVEVLDLVLPNQNADATLVSEVNMDDYNKLGIVGVMHSHHDMGHGSKENPGFSGHDERFINSNHNVSLLVSTKGIAGHIRAKTPCGAFIRVNATIKNMDEVDVDEKKLEEEFKSKIKFGAGRGYSHKGNTINLDRNNWHFK